jgi:hypothetical protein
MTFRTSPLSTVVSNGGNTIKSSTSCIELIVWRKPTAGPKPRRHLLEQPTGTTRSRSWPSATLLTYRHTSHHNPGPEAQVRCFSSPFGYNEPASQRTSSTQSESDPELIDRMREPQKRRREAAPPSNDGDTARQLAPVERADDAHAVDQDLYRPSRLGKTTAEPADAHRGPPPHRPSTQSCRVRRTRGRQVHAGSTSTRGARLLPVLVMEPRRTMSPVVRSGGTGLGARPEALWRITKLSRMRRMDAGRKKASASL